MAAQLTLIAAYLSHLPDAQVELVLYRRHAHALFGGFIPAPEVAARLASAAAEGRLAPGNGSNLTLAARLGATLLATRHGPLRVVVATDTLLAPSFRNEHALAALAPLPGRAVVHVVVPGLDSGEEPRLSRDDAAALAGLAAAHHGMFAELAGLSDSAPKALSAVVLGLVRPVQIDAVRLLGLPDALAEEDAVLREGRGLRLMLPVRSAPSQVTIVGKIWGRSFRRVVRANARFSAATAGWVFSEDEQDPLSEREMMTVALRGHAVSPVTSLLAVEPGVRPSTVGLELNGTGSGYGSGAGGFSGRDVALPRVAPDLRALLADPAARCLASHGHNGGPVMLNVDTTYDEVVDVTLASATAAGPLTKCLVEVIWALRLDPRFNLPHERFALSFP